MLRRIKGFICFFGMVAGQVLAQDLIIYAEDSPFIKSLHNGELTGQSVATVKEIQRRVQDKSNIEVVPWNRGYQFALTKANTALFPTTRTPEREKLFQWVGPLFVDEWVWVARKKDRIKISSLEDAKKV